MIEGKQEFVTLDRPHGYQDWVNEIKSRIQHAQSRARLAANAEFDPAVLEHWKGYSGQAIRLGLGGQGH